MATPEVLPAVEGPSVDDRPRWRRMVPPLAAGAGVIAATTYIKFVDPNQPGHYLVCPTRWLFGFDCPGCGGLRATHALANGDIAGAMDHNLLFVVLVPFLIAGWAVWMYRSWTGRRPALTPRRESLARVVPVALVAVCLVFAVVRNFVPYLGSGVG